jgi:formylglycine-generating enzyme required for sulfatase activity
MGRARGGQLLQPHNVTLTRPFALDRTEVTVEAYAQCMARGACSPNGIHGPNVTDEYKKRQSGGCNAPGDPGKQQHPINCVDRQQAAGYCAFAGKRLPTEAEWEYAARGSDGRLYPWGDQPAFGCEYAVLPGLCEPPGTRPVGTRDKHASSPFGVLDLIGNVAEWVADSYMPSSYDLDAIDPVTRVPEAPGLLRGGSWVFAPDSGSAVGRMRFDPLESSVASGIRCAQNL